MRYHEYLKNHSNNAALKNRYVMSPPGGHVDQVFRFRPLDVGAFGPPTAFYRFFQDVTGVTGDRGAT